jgi:hypothetical protein
VIWWGFFTSGGLESHIRNIFTSGGLANQIFFDGRSDAEWACGAFLQDDKRFDRAAPGPSTSLSGATKKPFQSIARPCKPMPHGGAGTVV